MGEGQEASKIFLTDSLQPWPLDAPKRSYQIHATAQITDSELEGPNAVDRYSAINRSTLGRYTNVGVGSYVVDASVGNFCMIGSRVSVGGFEHPLQHLSVGAFQWGVGISPDEPESVISSLKGNLKPTQKMTYLGSDVWIGSNACIRSGTAIGHGAVVGMGCVVVKDLPPYAIAVGNPGRIVGYRFDAKTRLRLLKSQWWLMPLEALCDLPFNEVGECLDMLERRTQLRQ